MTGRLIVDDAVLIIDGYDLYDRTARAWRANMQPLQGPPPGEVVHAEGCRLGAEYEVDAAWCPCNRTLDDLDV